MAPPPGRARSGLMWPGRARSPGRVPGSHRACTVAARSWAEMPVVVPRRIDRDGTDAALTGHGPRPPADREKLESGNHQGPTNGFRIARLPSTTCPCCRSSE